MRNLKGESISNLRILVFIYYFTYFTPQLSCQVACKMNELTNRSAKMAKSSSACRDYRISRCINREDRQRILFRCRLYFQFQMVMIAICRRQHYAIAHNLKVKQINYLVLSGDITNHSTVEELLNFTPFRECSAKS